MATITLANGATFTGTAQECAEFAIAQAKLEKPSARKGKASAEATVELVEFKKADGTVVHCTPAQKEAWEKFREGSSDRKEKFEAMKAGWADARKAYKPSKALKEAIKKDRASITHKVAKAQYGFVGTKNDLKALKDSICK